MLWYFSLKKITKCREDESDEEGGSTTVIIWSKAGMESTQLDTGSGERGSTGEATEATGTWEESCRLTNTWWQSSVWRELPWVRLWGWPGTTSGTTTSRTLSTEGWLCQIRPWQLSLEPKRSIASEWWEICDSTLYFIRSHLTWLISAKAHLTCTLISFFLTCWILKCLLKIIRFFLLLLVNTMK